MDQVAHQEQVDLVVHQAHQEQVVHQDLQEQVDLGVLRVHPVHQE